MGTPDIGLVELTFTTLDYIYEYTQGLSLSISLCVYIYVFFLCIYTKHNDIMITQAYPNNPYNLFQDGPK